MLARHGEMLMDYVQCGHHRHFRSVPKVCLPPRALIIRSSNDGPIRAGDPLRQADRTRHTLFQEPGWLQEPSRSCGDLHRLQSGTASTRVRASSTFRLKRPVPPSGWIAESVELDSRPAGHRKASRVSRCEFLNLINSVCPWITTALCRAVALVISWRHPAIATLKDNRPRVAVGL